MDEIFNLLVDELRGKTEQVYGFVQGSKQGFLLTHEGKQYVLELRERSPDESFTLFELGKPDGDGV